MSIQRNIHKVEVLEHRFEWKIEKFSLIAQNEGFIKSQSSEFQVEVDVDGIPTQLKWKLYLKKEQDKNNIGLFCTLLNCPDSWKKNDKVYVNMTNCSGFKKTPIQTKVDEIPVPTEPIKDYCSPASLGWKKWIDLESLSDDLEEDDALCITISIKLILTLPQSANPVFKVLNLFHKISSPKAKQAMINALLKSSIPSTNVTMISKDKKEYLAQWSVLAERCSVFARMYEANMKERETGIIEVKNMSGKTLKVFKCHCLNAISHITLKSPFITFLFQQELRIQLYSFR